MVVVGQSVQQTEKWGFEKANANSYGWQLQARPVAAIDPWSLLDATTDDAVLLWRSARDWDLALGSVAAIEASGADRFELARRAATALLEDVDAAGDPTAAQLFGGFGFADENHDAAFPPVRFVLPRWRWTQREDGTTLTAAVGRGELGEQVLAMAPHAGIAAGYRGARVVGVRGPAMEPWREEIEQVLAAIKRGDISKLVCARATAVELAEPLAVGHFLSALEAPRALRYVVRHGGETFFGATPERLVALSGGKVATEAIAGTAPSGDDEGRALLMSAKEREEHQIVVDAITQALAAVADTTVRTPEPQLLELGRLQHLRTRIAARLRESVHLLEVAGRLHPTPAVAGAPRAAALDLIASLPMGGRGGWYTGAVGWFDAQGEGELHVALRCAQTAGCRLEAWAGAGIVGASQAEREHQEIALKAATLLGPLQAVASTV